ncbi:MAG: VWA domain-containing protein [Planctomycetaceae bacterium]
MHPVHKHSEFPSSLRHRRRGAILILVILCLPVVLAFAVFAINVAWMQLTRTELRTATDAAAKAGSRMLSRSHDAAVARTFAHTAAGKNTVGGDPMLLAETDLQFGFSTADNSGLWTMTPLADAATNLNSLQVTGRRTAGSPGGPVTLLFNGFFDRTTFEPVKVATAAQVDRDIVLVLDRSGSMNTTTPTGNRWTDLQSAVYAFLSALDQTPQEELVGIVSYSTNATENLALTSSYASAASTVAGLGPAGYTAIGHGINVGRSVVTNPATSRSYARKTIVVMTDGIHNTGPMPVPQAALAFSEDITVHSITFSPGADQAQMQNVATAGGGLHWHADNQATLIAVFETIANNLPTLIIQ